MRTFLKLITLCSLAACSYDLGALEGTGDGGVGDGGADASPMGDSHVDTAPVGIPFVTGGSGGTLGTGGMLGTGGAVILPGTGGMLGTGGAPPITGGTGGMSESRPNGAACVLPAQCTSTHCLGDPGRCCNTACNGPGETCTTGFCEVTDPSVRSVAYNGHQYIFATVGSQAYTGDGLVGVGQWRSWDAARVWCKQYGYDLAIINDAAENAWLLTAVPQFMLPDGGAVGQWWIGITNQSDITQWVDVQGAAVSFLNWAPGQPDNGNPGERCGGFIRISTNTLYPQGTWNDRRCSTPSAFVCESL
jgi:hypothetical protein